MFFILERLKQRISFHGAEFLFFRRVHFLTPHTSSRGCLSINGCVTAPWLPRELITSSVEEKGNSFQERIRVVTSLKACAKQKNLQGGADIHDYILNRGFLEKNCHVASSLVNMYAKCGAFKKAAGVLQGLHSWNIYAWNALIAGYAQQGQCEEVLKCFKQMKCEGISPNAVTFTCILKVMGSRKDLKTGEQIHGEIVKQSLLEKDVLLGNALVDMYVKCENFAKAVQVLDELPVRDVVSWSAIIAGYAQCGQSENALKCLDQMLYEGLSPNAVTFVGILKACGSARALNKGEKIHYEVVRKGLLGRDTMLGNALLDMYAKCGALAKAAHVLVELSVRDTVSWNALITGYSQHYESNEALKCYEQMQCEGFLPDMVTFMCTLKACASTGAIAKGKQVHIEILEQGLLEKDVELGNTLVDMYAKCSALEKATQVLEDLPNQDVVTWSALIAGYVLEEKSEEALKCFKGMLREGLSPNAFTFSCILKGCGSLGAMGKGRQIHDEILRQDLLGKSIALSTSLVYMYVQCGALQIAAQVLDEFPVRDAASWNALIVGYVQLGQGEEALQCLEQMQHEGVSPDAVTLLCVLCACSRSRLLDDAQTYFTNMSRKFGIAADVGHHTCMIDLFGRNGDLGKALTVIKQMPLLNHLPAWHAFLDACRESGNKRLGELAFEIALRIDISSAAAYVLMTKAYIAIGMKQYE